MITTILEHAIPVVGALFGGYLLGRKLRGAPPPKGDRLR